MSDFVIGANEDDHHYTGANIGRDFPEPQVADIRNVVAGDPSPDGKGHARDLPRHRSGAHLSAAHQVFRAQ